MGKIDNEGLEKNIDRIEICRPNFADIADTT